MIADAQQSPPILCGPHQARQARTQSRRRLAQHDRIEVPSKPAIGLALVAHSESTVLVLLTSTNEGRAFYPILVAEDEKLTLMDNKHTEIVLTSRDGEIEITALLPDRKG